MKKQNAYERYLNQNQDWACMQEPFQTTNGLYVWEWWVTNQRGVCTEIRYYAEDVEGGNTMRVTKEEFLHLLNIKK